MPRSIITTHTGCFTAASPRDDQSAPSVLARGVLDFLMSITTKNYQNTTGGPASPSTALGEQLSAAHLGSSAASAATTKHKKNTEADLELQRRLDRLRDDDNDDDDDDAAGDEFVVRLDSSLPDGFQLPQPGVTVVRSLGVSELVKNIKSVLPNEEAREHYSYNVVRARRGRRETIDKAVISNEVDIDTVESCIAANKKAEPAVAIAERLDVYKKSAKKSRLSSTRKKRQRDETGDDEVRVGTFKKRAIVLPGGKVTRVERESYDEDEVEA